MNKEMNFTNEGNIINGGDSTVTNLPVVARCTLAPEFIPLHTNPWGDNIYVAANGDSGAMRMSYEFVAIDSHGRMSRSITVKRSDIMRKQRPLNCLLDLKVRLDTADMREMYQKLKGLREELEKDRNQLADGESVCPEELYLMLCEYCDNPTSEEDTGHIFLSDGFSQNIPVKYANIPVIRFKGIMRELDCGYKALEAKRTLRNMDRLRTNPDRLDYTIRNEDGYAIKVISMVYLDSEARDVYRAAYLGGDSDD
jgi:hypothetical protein